MTVALIIIGVVALSSTGLAIILMFRLLKSQGDSQSQDSAFGHQVGEIRQGMDRVNEAIQNLNVDRAKQSERLETMLTSLNSSSSALRDILANTQARGQWGERMAEDVFRIIGFVEHVNYVKQATVTDGSSRPDFTIFMPENKKLNMDAKFPLTNYVRLVEAGTEEEAQQHSLAFLRDVRDRAKEVVGRDYINSEDNTLDYVLVFIPMSRCFTTSNSTGPRWWKKRSATGWCSAHPSACSRSLASSDTLWITLLSNRLPTRYCPSWLSSTGNGSFLQRRWRPWAGVSNQHKPASSPLKAPEAGR